MIPDSCEVNIVRQTNSEFISRWRGANFHQRNPCPENPTAQNVDMQIQCRDLGLLNWLALAHKKRDLLKQAKTGPNDPWVLLAEHHSGAARPGRKTRYAFSVCDKWKQAAVERNILVIPDQTSTVQLASGFKPVGSIEGDPLGTIDNQKLRLDFGKLARRQNNIVKTPRAMEFPGRLEQLKELPHDGFLFGSDDDSNQRCRSIMAAVCLPQLAFSCRRTLQYTRRQTPPGLASTQDEWE